MEELLCLNEEGVIGWDNALGTKTNQDSISETTVHYYDDAHCTIA